MKSFCFWRGKPARDGTRTYQALLAPFLLALTVAGNVQAVPLYARQTGQQCMACHVSFPELTSYGRMFKLTGYTIGERTNIPLSAMAIVSDSVIKNQGTDAGNISGQYPKAGKPAFESGSVFYGGKITDHFGIFGQWTFNNMQPITDPNTNAVRFTRHSNIDNTDLRYSNRFTAFDREVIYGFTLNNNPTSQDVFNSTPAFGFPFQASRTAAAWNVNQGGTGVNVPPVTTQMEALGQQVAGPGAYVYINRHLYAEFAAYRTANKALSIFSAGINPATAVSLKGYSPYWRLAYSHDWAENSVSVGTYGMINRVNTNNIDPNSPTDKFTDIGIDAQYQFVGDPHTFTTQVNMIREKQDWDVLTHVGVNRDNPTSRLNTFRAKATYYYQRKYGVTGSYFASRTSSDCLQYSNATITCNAGGGTAGAGANLTDRNNSAGYVLELNYLPLQNVRVALQYTMFTKVQGLSGNYALAPDGTTLRSPRDNNLFYLYTWFAF